MKTKKILILLISSIIIASCQKEYTCVDANGSSVSMIKAKSKTDANTKCPTNSSAQ